MISAEQEVKEAQRDWAKSKGIAFNSWGYVGDVEANLYQPLSNKARLAFEKGAGSELSGRMRALHSSSALAVNFFDYWTNRDKSAIVSALSIDSSPANELDFESKFHTGLGGTPPHLDVAITQRTGFVVAIEGKFTEHLKRTTCGKSRFKSSYFPQSDGLWAKNGLPACQELAEEIWAEELRGGRQKFEYLDPRQLLKHTLGLATQLGDRFSLYYLYYDWPGERPREHRIETDLFGELIGGEIGFQALTYQEVFQRLKGSGQASADYLDYLETRYFKRMN